MGRGRRRRGRIGRPIEFPYDERHAQLRAAARRYYEKKKRRKKKS